MRRRFASALLLAALSAAPAAAFAQALAGAPEGSVGGDPSSWTPASHHHGHGRECYAQVRYPATYGPPPSGPEYVWTQAPAPPGAPGPVWCLTVTRFPDRPVQVAPPHLGWIRVLCADDATPERMSRLQRSLRARGLYRGEIDGRYDAQTGAAIGAFQQQAHIQDRGYLSYRTMEALEAPVPLLYGPSVYAPPPAITYGPPPGYASPPPPAYWRPAPTTFERGYVSWPGKSRYW